MTGQFDFTCDVLVVGSGGGALTGAYVAASKGLSVIVIESTDKFGGTTCYSGGGVWFPGNVVNARTGVADSNDRALEYFRRVVGDQTPADQQEAFVRGGPKLVDLLEQSPHLRFAWMAFPDYYGDYGVPPAHPRGRDIFPLPISRAELGPFADQVRDWMPTDIMGEPPTDPLGGGRALAARLLLAVADTGKADLRLNTEMDRLIVEEGRVVGAEAVSAGRRLRFGARKGVLLAAGGFERNQAMRDQYGMAGSAEWSCGAPGGTGKAIRAGIEMGADVSLMEECWWMPGLIQPNGRSGFIASVNGGIMVNAAGERFGNETGPYDRFGRLMRAGHQSGVSHVPAWWIWDSRHGPQVPSAVVSLPVLDRAIYEEAGLWKQAPTLDGLAAQIGVPAEALRRTVERFNSFAALGVDQDFHRGKTPYDVYIATELPAMFGLSDRLRPGSANPCLIPIETGPFYAAQIVLGDLGSKGGLRTDAAARVLRPDGAVIPGLYAAGDSMSSVAGRAYPAPGTPIGTCMVFSYLAALDMAGA